RISVIAALSGRPPRPQPSHRFAASGGVVSAAGIVLLAFADQRRAGFIIAGTVLTVAGVLILAPLAIRGLAAAGRRSTIAARLALRDLVRYQARSGAALGAITLAVGISATIAISAAAADTPTGPGNLPSNQMMVYLTPAGLGMDQIPPVDEAQQQALSAAVARLASSIGAVSTVPLEQAYDPTSGIWDAQPGGPASGGQPAGYATASLAEIIQRPHGEEITSPNTIYVATPAVLSHYGLQPSQVGPATDVVTGRTDLSGLQVFSPAGKSDPSLTTTQLRPHLQIDKQLPAYTSAPDILLTEHAMQEMGLQPIFAGWLIQTPGSLTSSQIATARQDAATVGLYVETRKPQSSNAALVNWSTTAGILLALGVLAMTVGLIRSETANDLRTLTATGASRRTRRALTAFTAGALAFLGASVGVAGSYAALLAWHRSDLAPLGRVPVANLVVILACLPVAAAAGGWLLAGRQPSAISRQPVE
ncbi:MAG TPA: hypothetical protein VFH54_18515, partial [Mycobacteriales bacterium]|nr:hypothetical protein [Mycobacteriales bacterium]